MTRLFASQESKARAAAECLVKAGHVHRHDGARLPAGNCFRQAAMLYEQGGCAYAAAQTLKLAWVQLRDAGDAASAAEAIGRAVELMLQVHRDYEAATLLHEAAAASYLDHQYAPAAAYFFRAAETYAPDSRASANASACLAQAASALALTSPPDFAQAARVFARLGVAALESPSRLAVWSCHRHFFSSVVCELAAGSVQRANAVWNIFAARDPSFAHSAHGNRARLLVAATDAEEFDRVCHSTWPSPAPAPAPALAPAPARAPAPEPASAASALHLVTLASSLALARPPSLAAYSLQSPAEGWLAAALAAARGVGRRRDLGAEADQLGAQGAGAGHGPPAAAAAAPVLE